MGEDADFVIWLAVAARAAAVVFHHFVSRFRNRRAWRRLQTMQRQQQQKG